MKKKQEEVISNFTRKAEARGKDGGRIDTMCYFPSQGKEGQESLYTYNTRCRWRRNCFQSEIYADTSSPGQG